MHVCYVPLACARGSAARLIRCKADPLQWLNDEALAVTTGFQPAKGLLIGVGTLLTCNGQRIERAPHSA